MYGTNESHGPNHGPWTPPPAPQLLPPQAQHQNHPRPHPHNHPPSHPPYVPPAYQHSHHHLPPQVIIDGHIDDGRFEAAKIENSRQMRTPGNDSSTPYTPRVRQARSTPASIARLRGLWIDQRSNDPFAPLLLDNVQLQRATVLSLSLSLSLSFSLGRITIGAGLEDRLARELTLKGERPRTASTYSCL